MTLQVSNRRGLRAAGPRRAFTILEIVVVLVILALAAGLSTPIFEAWLRGYRLRQGVEQVQTLWVKGRARALREGRPYRFGCAAGSNQYRLAPDGLQYWGGAAGADYAPPSSAAGSAPGLVVEGTLPKGVQFRGWLETLGGQGGQSGSDTVVFWPDGTAKIFAADGSERAETQLLIGDSRGQVRALYLRGLTGSATVVSKGRF